MQYTELSEKCEALLDLMRKARRDVPNAVEDMIDVTNDKILTMLEAIEAAWDIRTAE